MGDKAKILDKVKYFIGLDDLEEEYDAYDDTVSETEQYGSHYSKTTNKPNKVVNIHTNSNMRLVIHDPNKLEDATKIVADLKNRKPIVMNLQNLDSELKRQVFDFISGALYALEGHIQKVTKDIFILAPNNVEIDGNIKEELKSKGLFPWKKSY